MSDNIILVGPTGAGKTTLGKRLGVFLKRRFIDVDEEIETRLGVSIATIFDTEGESGFRQRELTVLRDILAHTQHAVIATGGGCVLTEGCRRLIVQERLVVHVDVSLDAQYYRLRLDKKRPILRDGDLREKLIELRKVRHKIYQSVADMRVETDRGHYRKILNQIAKTLEGNHHE